MVTIICNYTFMEKSLGSSESITFKIIKNIFSYNQKTKKLLKYFYIFTDAYVYAQRRA